MPIPVATVFADSHLAKRTWRHRPILMDSYYALEQIIEFTLGHELPLIGAGDLIDKRINEPEPIVKLQTQLNLLERRRIPFYYIQGQHELDDTPWLDLGKTAVHLHNNPLELGELQIYGIDYQGADALKVALGSIPESANVLIAHQVWSDFMGDIALPQGEFAQIPHVSTLVTGDFHQSILEHSKYKGAQGQDLLVFSPGATCMRSITEPEKHHFGVLCDDGSIDVIDLRSRKFDEFNILSSNDAEHLLEHVDTYLNEAADHAESNALPVELHTPLWRVVYSHRVSDLPRRLGKIVGDRAHLFWKEIPQEREESKVLLSVPDIRAGEALTLASCLTQEIDPDKEPEAYALAARLLDADDPELEANRWFKEKMNDGEVNDDTDGD